MSSQRECGAILSYVHIALTSILGVIYTPVIIRFLGQSEFGLYALISSITGYLSVLNLGIGDTSIRYISRNRVTKEICNSELNGHFFIIYFFLGIIVLAIGYCLYINVEFFFGKALNHDELQQLKLMVIILTTGLSISFPLSFFSSVLQAYEKFIVLRINDILRVLLNPLIALPFLYYGHGAITIVTIIISLNVIGIMFNTFYCIRHFKLDFSFENFSTSFLREIAYYTFWILLMLLTEQIYLGSGQFILGSLQGAKEIAIYAIAMQIIFTFTGFSYAIRNLLLPKVSMMVAEYSSSKELSDMMICIGRLQYMILGYIFVMFLLVGEKFLYLWAGGNYVAAYPITALLMGIMLIPLIQNIGVNILKAMNLQRYYTILCFLFAIFGVLISYPLAKVYGSWGCAVTMSIAVFISMGIFTNRYYAIKLHIDIWGFWSQICSLSGALLLLFIIGNMWSLFMDIPIGWTYFITECFIDTVIYFVTVYLWFMSSYERGLCRKIYLSIIHILRLRRI